MNIKVKPLSWREIDPERRFVGTGLGFTCEVRRIFKGTWEAVWPMGSGEYPDKATAMSVVEAAHEKMVLSFLEIGQ
jgi:hypothetical protein